MKHIMIIGIAVLLLVSGLSGCYDYDDSHLSAESNIIIKDCKVTIDHVDIDELYINSIDVLLKNEGSSSVRIDQIVLSSGDSEIEFILFLETIDGGEEKNISSSTYKSLTREIGTNQLNSIISLTWYSGEVLAQKNIIISIPIARVEDTIPEVGRDKHNLSFTILSWRESDVAVDGSTAFLARTGFKFIILVFEIQNNWIREQTTPSLDKGEVATDKGYIYSEWDWLDNYEEYESRKATEEEITTFIGYRASYRELLPEESIVGCIVFEIPEEYTATEMSINSVPPLITLEG